MHCRTSGGRGPEAAIQFPDQDGAELVERRLRFSSRPSSFHSWSHSMTRSASICLTSSSFVVTEICDPELLDSS